MASQIPHQFLGGVNVLGNNLTLGNNVFLTMSGHGGVDLNPAGLSSGEARAIKGMTGQTIDTGGGFGSPMTFAADGHWDNANAAIGSVLPCRGIAITDGGVSVNETIMFKGILRDTSWSWTPGGVIYLGRSSGTITQALSSFVSGDLVQGLGWAYSSSIIVFDPELIPIILKADL